MAKWKQLASSLEVGLHKHPNTKKKKQTAQVQSRKREEQKAKLIASNIYTLLSSLNVPSMTHPLTDQ